MRKPPDGVIQKIEISKKHKGKISWNRTVVEI